MKKILDKIFYITSLVILVFGGLYIVHEIAIRFPVFSTLINSQFVNGLITLFVGFIALYIYRRQNNDHRKDIAALILQEIRYAEQRLKEARDRDYVYLLSDKLLPTNSWHANIHMFVSSLEENQVDTISKFYSRVEFLDFLIKGIAQEKAFPERRMPITPIIVSPSNTEIQKNGNLPMSAIQPAQIQLSGPDAQKILIEVSNQIDFIYNSSAVEVLRGISKK